LVTGYWCDTEKFGVKDKQQWGFLPLANCPFNELYNQHFYESGMGNPERIEYE